MPTGEALKELLADLEEQDIQGQDAAIAVFKQDYDTSVDELAEMLGLDKWAVGRAKGQARRALGPQPAGSERAKTPEKPKEHKPERKDKPETHVTELSPSGKEFRRVAELILGKTERRTVEFLVDLYDKQPPEVKRERRTLENFLFRHGLTHIHVAGFLDMLMPGTDTGAMAPAWGMPQGQQGMLMDPTTGRLVPVLLPQGQGQPIVIQPPAAPPQPSLTAEDVRRIIRDEMLDRERAQARPPSPRMTLVIMFRPCY